MRTQILISATDTNDVDFKQNGYAESINVSQEVNLTTNMYRGFRGFQLSAEVDRVTCALDGTYKLYSEEGYAGVITKALSIADGRFTSATVFSFDAFSLDSAAVRAVKLYIVFDRACNEYATEFKVAVNGKVLDTLENDSVFAVVDLSQYTLDILNTVTVDIIVTRWSRPFSSAKVTSVTCSYRELFTESEFKTFECSETAFNTFAAVQPGVVAQYAELLLYDRNRSLRTFTSLGGASEVLDVELSVISEANEATVIGRYETSDWDFDTASLEVSIACVDPSHEFANIQVPAVFTNDRTVDDMLNLMFSYAKRALWRYDSDDTQQYCKDILVPNSWFKKGTLDAQLRKICSLGMLRIYWYVNTFIVTRCY